LDQSIYSIYIFEVALKSNLIHMKKKVLYTKKVTKHLQRQNYSYGGPPERMKVTYKVSSKAKYYSDCQSSCCTKKGFR